MIWWLLAAGLIAVTVVYLWDEISNIVAGWLRNIGWNKSFLMDAWVKLDEVMGRVRAKIFATDYTTRNIQITEREYNLNEIDDEDVVREIQMYGTADRNIMDLIQ